MISRIELENFMSHRRTVIEPAKGLTVLVGPNNCGKSAVVSALQVLCENAQGDYMVRHDEKECRIVVETDDGHRIEWKRRGTTVSYTLDGQDVHRLRGDIPEELHALLRLPKVQAADNREPYDIHFGLQKSPIFLLNEPGSRAATFFASSSDAGKLIEMQARHREKARQANQDERRFSEQVGRLQVQITILAPVEDIQARVDQAGRDYEALRVMLREMASMEDIREFISRHLATAEHRKAEVAALVNLAVPPILRNVAPLDDVIQAIETATKSASRETDRTNSLASLDEPPRMADTAVLDFLATNLGQVLALLALGEDVRAAMVRLTAPPPMGNVEILEKLCSGVEQFEEAVGRLTAQESSLVPLVPPPPQHDVPKLDNLLEQLSSAVEHAELAGERVEALATTSKPPEMQDIDSLRETVAAIIEAEIGCASHQAVQQILRFLPTVPPETDCGPMEEMVAEMEESSLAIGTRKKAMNTAARAVDKAEKALRQWARANRVCPTCGAALDPERLVKAAASGLKGHAHG